MEKWKAVHRLLYLRSVAQHLRCAHSVRAGYFVDGCVLLDFSIVPYSHARLDLGLRPHVYILVGPRSVRAFRVSREGPSLAEET